MRPVRRALGLALAAALLLAGCAHHLGRPGGYRSPEAANAASLTALAWSPFGKPERGWEIYLPFVAREIGAPPLAGSRAFAQALRRWQDAHGLPDTGVLSPVDFARMKAEALQRRPFVRLRATGVCPDAPDEATLVASLPQESWRGVVKPMRPGVLRAWRAMAQAARRDLPELRSTDALKVFSAYRSPAYDADRCAVEGNCDGLRRAQCSAHRTGLALDLVLDGVPPVDSTADADRMRLSRSPAYRWLVAHADRYGFVNYLYEPWHWEWTGEAIQPAAF